MKIRKTQKYETRGLVSQSRNPVLVIEYEKHGESSRIVSRNINEYSFNRNLHHRYHTRIKVSIK